MGNWRVPRYELVSDGGRPACSLGILDKIYEDPPTHVEVLRPWLETNEDLASLDPDDLVVFSRQLARWKEFRRWQRDNRMASGTGTETETESFAAFLAEKRRHFELAGHDQITAAPDFEESMQKIWEQEEGGRRWRQHTAREVRDGDGGFVEYAAAAQCRLAGHSLQPFQLLEDPEQQDRRTTWIEYLEFECWWLSECERLVRHHQHKRDAAWERSGVLRDGEAEEQLHGESQHQGPRSARRKRRLCGQGGATRGVINGISRDRFRQEEQPYMSAKADESRQRLVVEWALRLVPLVEEVATASASKSAAAEIGKRKRKDSDDRVMEEAMEEAHQSKKQKQGKKGGAAGPGVVSRPRPRERRLISGLITR